MNAKKIIKLAQELIELVQSTMVSSLKIIVVRRSDFHLTHSFEAYKHIQPDLGANGEDLRAYIYSAFKMTHKKASTTGFEKNASRKPTVCFFG